MNNILNFIITSAVVILTGIITAFFVVLNCAKRDMEIEEKRKGRKKNDNI